MALNSYNNMNLYEMFLRENERISCAMCGSQRCDRTPMWIEGCQSYQEFKKHLLEENKYLTEW